MPDVAAHPYNLLSICAGSGALDLGIAVARPGARSVCLVERGAYQAELLVARMEAGDLSQAPIWSDLATFDPGPWRGVVDCVASGDPCQPNSLAGKHGGVDDDRWLLDHVIRIVDGVRPARFFRENVTGNADGQLACLIPPLEGMGYRVACGVFTAGGAGFSHGRPRLFVMADRDGARSQVAQQPGEPGTKELEFQARSTACELRRVGTAGDVVDDHGGRGEGFSAHQRQRKERRASPGWAGDLALFAPRPRDPVWRDVIRDAPGLKPAIRRVADGLADRMDRIETAGNGVVSVVAARAWLGLEALLIAGAEAAAQPVRMRASA